MHSSYVENWKYGLARRDAKPADAYDRRNKYSGIVKVNYADQLYTTLYVLVYFVQYVISVFISVYF